MGCDLSLYVEVRNEDKWNLLPWPCTFTYDVTYSADILNIGYPRALLGLIQDNFEHGKVYSDASPKLVEMLDNDTDGVYSCSLKDFLFLCYSQMYNPDEWQDYDLNFKCMDLKILERLAPVKDTRLTFVFSY